MRVEALRPRFRSLLEAWQRHRDERPDDVAVWFVDEAWTYRDVDAAAEAMAASLAGHGVGRGDRVALYLQNDPQSVVAALAAWRLGAVPVTVSPMLVAEELTHQLRDSGAAALVCLTELWDSVAADVVPSTPVRVAVLTDPLGEGADQVVPLPSSGEQPAGRAADLEDLGFLTYTSGTTGKPKGALNTHAALAYNSQVYADWWDLRAGQDVVLCVAPLFHITGVVAGLGVALTAGVPLVLLHRFDVEATLRAIQDRRATFVVAASTAYVALSTHPARASYDLSSLTKTLSGGAPVSAALVERVRVATGWELHGAYGMTETTSPTHLGPPGVVPPSDPGSGALSVGVPVPGCRVRIVDPDSGADLPYGRVGEIVVAGPMVVAGYWAQPEASAAAVRDGWLHTGDLGHQSADGWLFVVDRLKDLINAGGYKVFPRDVEEVLLRHEAVREVAVVGVPDDYRGETVKAVVSLLTGATTSPEELVAFCRERMAAYKYPRIVEVVAELPKSAAGKILRRELRADGSPAAS